ncbi:TRAP transporter small permease [Donghicola sp. C2-DW-16]|uniref:TRAP transporter small permease protein n=1 Tax=Donghicola mangrovi TaxID=2729614 RepID=A0A850QCL8_9RHOB|nr:TRAP transporter small permease [Donghicola mangrovi]NVO24640.1 TRAP transporter small permease [Donghicola mangrovi]NVO28888.1 TRAP transporter small permease [Donghicola mangrovi]
MKRILALYADIMDGVSVFVGQACSVLFFACIGVSAYEVVARYGFDAPTLWSTELAMTLCASAWVLSVGYVTERHRHISITMLEILVGERVWRVFRLIQMIVATGAVITLSMALYHPAAKVLSRTEYSGTALNSIQPTYLKVLIFVGCIFYILQLLANIIRWAQRTEGDVTGGH